MTIQEHLLVCLRQQPYSVTEIADLTHWSLPQVRGAMSNLVLKRIIEREPTHGYRNDCSHRPAHRYRIVQLARDAARVEQDMNDRWR